MATITITGSNSSTGELTLSDHGHTHAKKKETIVWILRKDCGVESIEEIAMAPSPPYPPSLNIFYNPPYKLSKSNWKAVIGTPPDYSEYNYYIKWIPKSGVNELTYDPKISIEPTFFFSIQKVVAFILAIFMACAAAILFTKKRKKKK